MKLIYSYIKGAICLSDAIKRSRWKDQGRISNKNKSTATAIARMIVSGLSLILYSLFTFSLSAQEPRKDSGADGQAREVSIGHSVPKDFWTKKHLFFVNGDTIRKSFAEFKGKMLVLDFWFSGCAPCLLHQQSIRFFQKQYPNDLIVVMVNSKSSKEGYQKVADLYQNGFFSKFALDSFESIIEDDYLQRLFPYTSYPHYVWINRLGRLQLRTFRNLLDKNYVVPYIDLER